MYYFEVVISLSVHLIRTSGKHRRYAVVPKARNHKPSNINFISFT